MPRRERLWPRRADGILTINCPIGGKTLRVFLPHTRNGLRASLSQRGARQGCRNSLDSELHGRRERERLQSVGSANERPYMDPSSFASTPFFGGKVRLLTYIRPLTAASI